MTDFPRHEAVVALLRHFGDPSRAPPGLYAIHPGYPHQLFHLLAWPLSLVASVTLACKLVVAATMIAIPVAAARLARRRGGTGWVAPVLVPLTLGWQFSHGYVSELLGLALLLAFLPALDRFVAEPSIRRLGAAASGTVAIYFAHELMLLVYVVATFVFAALRPVDVRRTPLRAAPGLLGIALVAAAATAEVAPSAPTSMGALKARIVGLPETLVGSSDPGSQIILFTLCALVLVMFALDGRRAPKASAATGLPIVIMAAGRVEQIQAGLWSRRFALLAAVCWVLYLAMPASFGGYVHVYERLLAPAYALLAVAIDISAGTSARRLSGALAGSLPIASLLVAWPAFVDSSRNAEDLDRLLVQVRAPSSVAGIDLGHPSPRSYELGPSTNRVIVERGGRVLEPVRDAFPPLIGVAPAFRWDEPAARLARDSYQLRPSHDLRRFRYVVVYGGSTQDVHVVAAALLPDARFVDTSGEWTLFESTHAVTPLDAPDVALPSPRPATLRTRVGRILTPAPREVKPAAAPAAH